MAIRAREGGVIPGLEVFFGCSGRFEKVLGILGVSREIADRISNPFVNGVNGGKRPSSPTSQDLRLFIRFARRRDALPAVPTTIFISSVADVKQLGSAGSSAHLQDAVARTLLSLLLRRTASLLTKP